jgi:hypothetical protein
MSLIIEDLALTLEDGGVHTGATPSYGTPVDATCQLRNFKVKTSVTKKDVSGGCAGSKKSRYAKPDGEITIEAMTLATGAYLFAGTTTPEGRVIRIKAKTLASLSTWRTYVGVITEWEGSADMEGAQVERVTIDLTPLFNS